MHQAYLFNIALYIDRQMEEKLEAVENIEGVPCGVCPVLTMKHTLEDTLSILIALCNKK